MLIGASAILAGGLYVSYQASRRRAEHDVIRGASSFSVVYCYSNQTAGCGHTSDFYSILSRVGE
jgi:hypothetical protein